MEYERTADANGFAVINDVSAPALAAEFSRFLRKHLNAYELACAITLNDDEPSDAICHTHDFCDANEVMAQACEAAGVEILLPCDAHVCNDECRSNGCTNRHADEETLQDQCDWINEAWSLAKRAKFEPDNVAAVVRQIAESGA